MSKQEIRNHLKSALTTIVEAEQERVSAVLEAEDERVSATLKDAEINIAKRVEMMKPLISLIQDLKEEAGEVEGLRIEISPHGHFASVFALTSMTHDYLGISTNSKNTAYEIEEEHDRRDDNCCRTHYADYPSVDDVMARVLEFVGKHIGGQQAQQMHKNV